jgi:hypothetical protein
MNLLLRKVLVCQQLEEVAKVITAETDIPHEMNMGTLSQVCLSLNSILCSELLGSWTLSIAQRSKKTTEHDVLLTGTVSILR